MQSAERLRSPLLRVGRELQETNLDEALRYSAMRLKELTRRYSGDQIAVFVSPRLTNEEIYLAQKLARLALRTHNVTSLAHLVNRDLQAPDVISTASYADVGDAQALLVVNTALDEESFVGGPRLQAGDPQGRPARLRRPRGQPHLALRRAAPALPARRAGLCRPRPAEGLRGPQAGRPRRPAGAGPGGGGARRRAPRGALGGGARRLARGGRRSWPGPSSR